MTAATIARAKELLASPAMWIELDDHVTRILRATLATVPAWSQLSAEEQRQSARRTATGPEPTGRLLGGLCERQQRHHTEHFPCLFG